MRSLDPLGNVIACWALLRFWAVVLRTFGVQVGLRTWHLRVHEQSAVATTWVKRNTLS